MSGGGGVLLWCGVCDLWWEESVFRPHRCTINHSKRLASERAHTIECPPRQHQTNHLRLAAAPAADEIKLLSALFEPGGQLKFTEGNSYESTREELCASQNRFEKKKNLDHSFIAILCMCA